MRGLNKMIYKIETKEIVPEMPTGVMMETSLVSLVDALRDAGMIYKNEKVTHIEITEDIPPRIRLRMENWPIKN